MTAFLHRCRTKKKYKSHRVLRFDEEKERRTELIHEKINRYVRGRGRGLLKDVRLLLKLAWTD